MTDSTKTTWIPGGLLPFLAFTERDVMILSFLLVFASSQVSCEVTPSPGMTVTFSILGIISTIVYYACIAGCIYLCVRASRDTGPVGVYQQPQPYGAPNPYGGQNPYGAGYQPTIQPVASQPVGTGGETGAVGSNYGTANY